MIAASGSNEAIGSSSPYGTGLRDIGSTRFIGHLKERDPAVKNWISSGILSVKDFEALGQLVSQKGFPVRKHLRARLRRSPEIFTEPPPGMQSLVSLSSFSSTFTITKAMGSRCKVGSVSVRWSARGRNLDEFNRDHSPRTSIFTRKLLMSRRKVHRVSCAIARRE